MGEIGCDTISLSLKFHKDDISFDRGIWFDRAIKGIAIANVLTEEWSWLVEIISLGLFGLI